MKWAATRYENAIGPSAARTYSKGVKHLASWIASFCPEESGISVEDPDEETLVLWALYESQWMKGASVYSYLHGVRDYNLDLGHGNILTAKFRL